MRLLLLRLLYMMDGGKGGINLRQLLRLALWGAACFAASWAAVELLVGGFNSTPAPGDCTLDNEGQWSIGLFQGSNIHSLQPIEQRQPRADTKAAWPVANPIYTCAHVTDVPSSFVADPFLYMKDDKHWYLFFETKSLHNMQGDIGAAESMDGGLTWKHVGVVLDESTHLSYPFVFKYEGKMYMMPENSKSGTLRLYTTDTFPTGWRLDKVLINEALIDASLVPPTPGVANNDGKWYLFASNRNQPTSKNCRELEIWMADDLHGPWRPHPLNPVRAGLQGSRMAGRPVVADGQLYRPAQDCQFTYGHRVRMFHVTSLNSTHFEEREHRLGFDPASGRQGDVTWNSLRYHHMDAHKLSSGDWVAVMDGDRYVSDYLTWRWLQRQVVVVPLILLLSFTVVICMAQGGVCGVLRTCGTTSWGRSAKQYADSVLVWPAWTHGLLPVSDDGDTASKRTVFRSSPGRKSWLGNTLTDMNTACRRPLRFCGGLNGWQVAGILAALLMVFWLGAWLFWTVGRLQLLHFIVWYLHAAGGSVQPRPVDLQYSKFTMLVMSYDARLLTLQTFVRHYSQCSSVAEIVVVWNKGTPPHPLTDLPPSQVPVRVRAEAKNSMNNRFQPDPLIKTRAVLMLDDDILMPCSDIERGFARWRAHPERITGYYPRILEGNPPQYQCRHCEGHTYDSGRYNLVLAGASFLDSELVFPLYSSAENKPGRDYVDKVFNCDDLLLNFLMASHLKDKQYVEWVRPTKRFDVGRLTSKRLSNQAGNFGPVRHNCTRDFAAMFGNPLLDRSYPLDFDGMGKPSCPTGIGCIFI